MNTQVDQEQPDSQTATQTDKNTGKGMNDTMKLLIKMTLANSQDIRSLRGAVITVFLIPESAEIQKVMAEAGANYAEAASKLNQNDRRQGILGIPAYHRWNALLQHYAAKVQPDDDKGRRIKSYIETYKNCSKENIFEKLADGIKHLVLRKAYDKGVKKMEIAVVPNSPEGAIWMEAIRPLIVAEPGVKALRGAPPPGEMERRLQDKIAS